MFMNVFKSFNMVIMLFKQQIKRVFPQWLITRLFDDYFYIKILLDLKRPIIDKNTTCVCYCTHVIFDAVGCPMLTPCNFFQLK